MYLIGDCLALAQANAPSKSVASVAPDSGSCAWKKQFGQVGKCLHVRFAIAVMLFVPMK
jgi:hypothetical protein